MSLSYFKVYRDFIGIARELDNGARGKLFMALLQYINDEELIALSGMERIAFLTLKAQIDRDAESYTDVCEKRKRAGEKGAASRWKAKNTSEEMANAILPYSKNGKNSKEEDKEEDKDKDKDKKKRGNNAQMRFTPPSVYDVRAYCLERGNYVDAQRFVDYYAAKGWMVGKNQMKDWKAAVRTWEQSENRRKEGAHERMGNHSCTSNAAQSPDERWGITYAYDPNAES